MKQQSLGLGSSSKRTRKCEFLGVMERVVPWGDLVALIGPYLPEGWRGRPPFSVEAMPAPPARRAQAGAPDPGDHQRIAAGQGPIAARGHGGRCHADTAQLFTVSALSNLWMVRSKLLRGQAWVRLKQANAARLPANQSPLRAERPPGPVDLSPGSLSWIKSSCYPAVQRFVQIFPKSLRHVAVCRNSASLLGSGPHSRRSRSTSGPFERAVPCPSRTTRTRLWGAPLQNHDEAPGRHARAVARCASTYVE
jgi:hypothetical protein